MLRVAAYLLVLLLVVPALRVLSYHHRLRQYRTSHGPSTTPAQYIAERYASTGHRASHSATSQYRALHSTTSVPGSRSVLGGTS
eukprot:3777498-Rhodomonas_salina.1